MDRNSKRFCNRIKMPTEMRGPPVHFHFQPCHQSPYWRRNKLLHDIENFCNFHQGNMPVEERFDQPACISSWHKLFEKKNNQ